MSSQFEFRAMQDLITTLSRRVASLERRTPYGQNIICTNLTRPQVVFEGLLIYDTDDDQQYVWDGTQWSPMPTGLTLGPRNRVINGGFDVWQRGAGPFAVGSFTYGADQWNGIVSGSTCSNSRQDFTYGNEIPEYEPTYFHRSTVASSPGAGNFAHLRQHMESVRTFAGQTITISFWAKADAAKPISLEMEQNFGSGGGPSAGVSVPVTKVDLTTSWVRYSVTVDVPSISSKALGTTHDGYLCLIFWFDAGSTFDARTDTLGQQSGTFDLWGVQVEGGEGATRYDQRPYGETLTACERYFWRRAQKTGFPPFGVGACASGTAAQAVVVFPTTMRATPTMTPGSVAADFGVSNAAGATLACNGLPTLNQASPSSALVGAAVAAGLVAGNATLLLSNNTANAVLDFSAEL